MVLDTITSFLPWNWGSGSSGHSHRSTANDKGKSRKYVRTRAAQQAMNGNANGSGESSDDDGYYPGLVNISGTYCFLNSTLQALASLSYLKPHIDAIHAKAEALDVPSPVIDALQNILHELNTPQSYSKSLRPMEIIEVLSGTGGRTSSLITSREHQDAQELFQLLSECLKNELIAVEKEGSRDRGLGGLEDEDAEVTRKIGKSVFDGLTANRRSCTVCGYTEAVMHFSFDNWQLAVPVAATVYLESCLKDYTKLEYLRDCICRKCSLLATSRRLETEYRTLEEAARPEARPTESKKRRLAAVRKMKNRVNAALEEGRIEDDLKDVRLEKVYSDLSTKQAMIARPPPVLALHINRSLHYGLYAARNSVRVIFPEVLDLTPFTTSGSLSTIPTSAISNPTAPFRRSTTPTPATYAHQPVVYRLSAVICHYGQHSFGHYVAYRRKPRNGKPRSTPHLVIDPFASNVDDESLMPQYSWEGEEPNRPGRGWLRVSDDAVKEVGIESVLQENSSAFMLFYEQVQLSSPGVYPSKGSPRGSEETLKPELKTLDLNGSSASLVCEVGIGVKSERKASISDGSVTGGDALVTGSLSRSGSQTIAPRVIRRTAARRSLTESNTPRLSLSGSLPISSTLSTSPESTSTTPRSNGHAKSSSHPSSVSTSKPKHSHKDISSPPTPSPIPVPAVQEPNTPPASPTIPANTHRSKKVRSARESYPTDSRPTHLPVVIPRASASLLPLKQPLSSSPPLPLTIAASTTPLKPHLPNGSISTAPLPAPIAGLQT